MVSKVSIGKVWAWMRCSTCIWWRACECACSNGRSCCKRVDVVSIHCVGFYDHLWSFFKTNTFLHFQFRVPSVLSYLTVSIWKSWTHMKLPLELLGKRWRCSMTITWFQFTDLVCTFDFRNSLTYVSHVYQVMSVWRFKVGCIVLRHLIVAEWFYLVLSVHQATQKPLIRLFSPLEETGLEFVTDLEMCLPNIRLLVYLVYYLLRQSLSYSRILCNHNAYVFTVSSPLSRRLVWLVQLPSLHLFIKLFQLSNRHEVGRVLITQSAFYGKIRKWSCVQTR